MAAGGTLETMVPEKETGQHLCWWTEKLLFLPGKEDRSQSVRWDQGAWLAGQDIHMYLGPAASGTG